MCRFRHESVGRLVLLLIAVLPAAAWPAAAQEPVADVPAAEGPTVYLLSVRVNGWPLGLVARFHEEGGRLSLPADQYAGLGFRLDETLVTEVDGQQRVFLDQIEGVTWEIDMRAQTIDIVTPFELLEPDVLRISPAVARVESRSNWGALFGYDLYGEYSSRPRSDIYARAFSVDLEARLFSPRFMASTRGYWSISEGEDRGEFVRLESAIDFDNPDQVWRLRLGDSITVGPVWLRTLRFGGVQWGREFGLRPDIVTTPIPVLSQDISVPSTVDVFINEVQRYSNAVEPGALRVTDLPTVAGSNRVRVVITDQSGRRTEVFLPLYSSIELLGRGLSTFNLELGAERQQYAVESNEYGPIFGSAAAGYGVTDRLTLRGYGAVSNGYAMGAVGATAALGRLLLVEASGMYSDGPQGSGWAWYASAEHVSGRLNLFGSYTKASRGFRDLAGNFGYTSFTDQAIFSGGLNFEKLGYFNIAYLMQRELDGDRTSVLSGSYGIDVFRRRVNLSVSGYSDLRQGDWGLVLSMTFPVGPRVRTYAEHSWRNGVLSSAANMRGEGYRDRLDWEIAGEQGEFDEVSAEAGWDGERIDMRYRAAESNGEYGFRGEVAQSLVLMDGRLNLAGRIDDGFAIVEVEDMPGVQVSLENRVIGRTGRNGRLFVTGLNSYVGNAISIDPLDLPIDATIPDTAMLVSPRGGGGLVARFPVNRDSAAIVVLQLPDGTPPPVGANVTLEGSDRQMIAGHDGEVYVRGIASGSNRLTLSWRNGQCSADFTAQVESGTLPRLGPFVCAP